jgi:hypothetical protein
MGHATIHTDEEYMTKFYPTIKKQCSENGMRCELKFDKIFIYTMAEEFYFQFTVDRALNNKFILMHRGFNRWDKISDEYHKQQKKFTTPYDMVESITRHTKKKYGVL